MELHIVIPGWALWAVGLPAYLLIGVLVARHAARIQRWRRRDDSHILCALLTSLLWPLAVVTFAALHVFGFLMWLFCQTVLPSRSKRHACTH